MFAIGNEELKSKADLGATVKCNNCGKRHKVTYGEVVKPDGTIESYGYLAFIKCPSNGTTYLVGISGKAI